jgi:hypothetical protein
MLIVSNLPDGTEGRQIHVVMRLPDDTPQIVRYDINLTSTAGAKVEAFAVEGSNDGENWIELAGDMTSFSTSGWASGDEFVEGHPLRPGRGLAFDRIPVAPDMDASTVLDNVTSVQVAAGATLSAKGAAKTVSNLTVDCFAGAGALEGIEFAADGTVNLVNLPEKALEFCVPASFGKVSAASLANVGGWSVSVDGRASSHWSVKVTADSIRGKKLGLSLIVR